MLTNLQNNILDGLQHSFLSNCFNPTTPRLPYSGLAGVHSQQFSFVVFLLMNIQKKIRAISDWSISTQKHRIYIHYCAVFSRKTYVDKNNIQFYRVLIKKVYNFSDSFPHRTHSHTHLHTHSLTHSH